MEVIDRNQPAAMVFNMGRPTVRWIGNEDGFASDPVCYAVRDTPTSVRTDDRQQLGQPRYPPPECDVSIRGGWFWHLNEEHTLKSASHLAAIWYRSIRLGANLLLNVPPDRRGLIDDHDRECLLAFTGEIQERFASPAPASLDRLLGNARRDRPSRDRGGCEGWAKDRPASHHRHRERVHHFTRVCTSGVLIETDQEDDAITRVEAHFSQLDGIPALEPQPAIRADRLDHSQHDG